MANRRDGGAKLEIESECALPEGAPAFSYTDPRGGFMVRLSNRVVRPLVEKPLLEMQLEFNAPDLRTADATVKPIARRFLYWLSFVTHCAFRIGRIERLIDWTPGLSMREQYVYHADGPNMPQPVLVQELADTIALFNTEDAPPEVQRAIRWFANGVAVDLLDAQFQCFFFAIEIPPNSTSLLRACRTSHAVR